MEIGTRRMNPPRVLLPTEPDALRRTKWLLKFDEGRSWFADAWSLGHLGTDSLRRSLRTVRQHAFVYMAECIFDAPPRTFEVLATISVLEELGSMHSGVPLSSCVFDPDGSIQTPRLVESQDVDTRVNKRPERGWRSRVLVTCMP